MCYITDAKDALTAFFLCAFKHILSIFLRLDPYFVWILPLCRALALFAIFPYSSLLFFTSVLFHLAVSVLPLLLTLSHTVITPTFI